MGLFRRSSKDNVVKVSSDSEVGAVLSQNEISHRFIEAALNFDSDKQSKIIDEWRSHPYCEKDPRFNLMIAGYYASINDLVSCERHLKLYSEQVGARMFLAREMEFYEQVNKGVIINNGGKHLVDKYFE